MNGKERFVQKVNGKGEDDNSSDDDSSDDGDNDDDNGVDCRT